MNVCARVCVRGLQSLLRLGFLGGCFGVIWVVL